jgi:phosphate transport system protein
MLGRWLFGSSEKQLQELRQRLLRMAGLVEQMIARSVEALVTRDSKLALATIEADRKVNRSEMEADDLCRRILEQPRVSGDDVRFVTQALKMVTDLERIADLAVNICERAVDLNLSSPLASFDDVSRMATLVQSMVRDAIDAFVSGDASMARTVIDRDDDVDELYHKVYRDLLEVMVAEPHAVERGIHVQSVAKFLERMADHCTNIAEQVVYLVEAEDIRHAGKLEER